MIDGDTSARLGTIPRRACSSQPCFSWASSPLFRLRRRS